MAIYGERVAGLPHMLEALHYHPRGLRFDELAREVGRSEADVRETLRIYHLTDLAVHLPDLVARPDVVEFFGGDPEDDGDALRARMVRLVTDDPGGELGVGYVSLSDLARMYRIAQDASRLDPDDFVLASAVRKLHDGVLPSLRIIEPEPWARLSELRAAIAAHRRVRLRYARVWSTELQERMIEPLWLVRTRRGWELDASPGDELDAIRTYLLSNVRELEVLDEEFTPSDDIRALVARHRAWTEVLLDTPHDARWAVDKYAERVELVADGVETARLRVLLLQPVRLRVGLMLVVGGPSARVLTPAHLRDAGAEVARTILSRYEDNPAG